MPKKKQKIKSKSSPSNSAPAQQKMKRGDDDSDNNIVHTKASKETKHTQKKKNFFSNFNQCALICVGGSCAQKTNIPSNGGPAVKETKVFVATFNSQNTNMCTCASLGSCRMIHLCVFCHRPLAGVRHFGEVSQRNKHHRQQNKKRRRLVRFLKVQAKKSSQLLSTPRKTILTSR